VVRELRAFEQLNVKQQFTARDVRTMWVDRYWQK
jgi:hypothetical protein